MTVSTAGIDDSPRVAPAPTLAYLPVALFGSVMGLTGLGVAWRLAHERYGAPAWIATAIGAVSIVVFVAMTVSYAVKMVAAPDAVRAEFSHPIAGNLFGTAVISLLLLPIVIAPLCLPVAQGMWAAGAILMLLFAWRILDRWLGHRQQVLHATPAWIIPVVGLLDIPLAVPSLDLPPLHGPMVVTLAVGLFFAVPLFTMIFARLVFEAPLPDALQPSLMILLAPFAVGLSTYVATVRAIDLFAQSLYGITLFLLCVLVGRLRHLARCCPFRVSWWAVGFPIAAATIASLKIAAAFPGRVNDGVALAILAFATLLIGWLFARTLAGILSGELRALST